MEEASEVGSNQSILEHLNDLRVRLTWAAVALIVATVISFIFAEQILNFLMRPYNASVIGGATLQTLRPTEGIETFFKVALLSGAIIAMPIILYQFWLFISPGLTDQEKKYVYIFIPSALVLFLLGIAFAWFILAPAAIFFLANFMTNIFKTDWTGQEYISFVTRMLFWMGVAFELPIVVYFVARVGIITAEWLRSQWRFAIVGVAVLAAMITPSIDPVTMLLTMAPLLVLYLLSIVLAKVGQRQYEHSIAI
ncbi:MAG: twin-arginine translocase subunit TatC [Anaerolineales bacterium]|nr:twin-arginine translocase subunit TatC [Anaerolineales bacterium]